MARRRPVRARTVHVHVHVNTAERRLRRRQRRERGGQHVEREDLAARAGLGTALRGARRRGGCTRRRVPAHARCRRSPLAARGARSWRQRERRGTGTRHCQPALASYFARLPKRARPLLAHRTGCERDGHCERSTAGGEEVLAQGTRRCMHGPPLRVARAQRPPCCVSSPRRTTRMASSRSLSSRPTVRRHGQSATAPCPSSAVLPPLSAHGGSGWLGAPRGEAGPLGAQPPPRVPELAAYRAADLAAFD